MRPAGRDDCVALLVAAADIMDALRSETARLEGDAREQAIAGRLGAIRSLHSRDGSIIATTGVSNADVRDKAETDWKTATEDWERALEELQRELARAQSAQLALGQLWALTRLFGAVGFRAGIEVIFELVRNGEIAGESAAEWESLSSFDAGDRDDVVPLALSRSPLFGGPPSLGIPTSIGRSIRSLRGEATGEGLPTKANLEQEISALGADPNAIRQLESLYRESAERIIQVREIAARRGIADHEVALEASRRLLSDAAKIIRELAPDQFITASAEPRGAGAAGGSGSTRDAVDLAGSEDRYLIVRDRKLKELEAIGAWFRRFEPHNPVGYVIPELSRRAVLDLPRLLTDLFGAAEADAAALKRIFTMLGVAEPAPSSADGPPSA